MCDKLTDELDDDSNPAGSPLNYLRVFGVQWVTCIIKKVASRQGWFKGTSK